MSRPYSVGGGTGTGGKASLNGTVAAAPAAEVLQAKRAWVADHYGHTPPRPRTTLL